MANQIAKNIRLGVFVLAGTLFMITGLYLIGNKQNLFGNTFRLNAAFYNVNGLMNGNNVRFSGIDVGTVESVKIITDSSVRVVMLIKESARSFIKKNALASIGTDGLMGNKLVNINSVEDHTPSVEEGDELQTIRPIDQDVMMRTLNSTNENLKATTFNLRSITDKINNKNTLWSILMDTIIAEKVKATIVNIKTTSDHTAIITGNLKNIITDIKEGKGSLGAFIVDNSIYDKLNQVIVKFEKISDTTAAISGNLSQITKDIKDGKGAVGIFLKDTSLIHNLNKSMENIKDGSKNFDENMEALKYSWPFKKYFKKQKKIKKQSK